MEITSFVLGVCAVIMLLMVVGTSVNYMVTKELKKEIENLKQVQAHQSRDLDDYNNSLLANLKATRDDLIHYTDQLHNNTQDEMNKLYGYVDSRVDKLDTRTKQNLQALDKEISRVENGYKEKINY